MAATADKASFFLVDHLDWADDRRVSRLHQRPCQGTRLRRTRCGCKLAMADDRGRESQRSVGAEELRSDKLRADPASPRLSWRGAGSRAEHWSIGGRCLRTAERKPMLCGQHERRNEDDKRGDQRRHPNAAASCREIPRIILGLGHLALGTRSNRASVPLVGRSPAS